MSEIIKKTGYKKILIGYSKFIVKSTILLEKIHINCRCSYDDSGIEEFLQRDTSPHELIYSYMYSTLSNEEKLTLLNNIKKSKEIEEINKNILYKIDLKNTIEENKNDNYYESETDNEYIVNHGIDYDDYIYKSYYIENYHIYDFGDSFIDIRKLRTDLVALVCKSSDYYKFIKFKENITNIEDHVIEIIDTLGFISGLLVNKEYREIIHSEVQRYYQELKKNKKIDKYWEAEKTKRHHERARKKRELEKRNKRREEEKKKELEEEKKKLEEEKKRKDEEEKKRKEKIEELDKKIEMSGLSEALDDIYDTLDSDSNRDEDDYYDDY